MKVKLLAVLTIVMMISFSIIGCSDDSAANDDKVTTVPKNASVEESTTIEHLASGQQILHISYSAYDNGGKLLTTKEVVDSLPNLGTTIEDGDEDDDGNVPKVTVPKDYTIYVTVK